MNRQEGLKKGVLVLLSLFVLFSAMLRPQEAQAHDTYFLQTMVNQADYSYAHQVHYENRGFLQSGECTHMELKIADFHKMLKINKEKNIHPSTLTLEEMESEWGEQGTGEEEKCSVGDGGIVGGKYLTFGFAPYQLTSALMFIRNNANKHDGERANLVANTLVPALNTAMNFVYGDSPDSEEELFKRSKAFSQAIQSVNGSGSATVNGATFKRGKMSPYKGGIDKKTGLTNEDWVTIEKDGDKADFPYQMLKGYSTDGGKGFDFKNLGGFHSSLWHDGSYKKDASHMTWNLLMYQANYSFHVLGIDVNNNDAVGGVGMLERHLVTLLQNVLLGLSSILGLEQMGDLVFNDGNRGFSTYYGAFNSKWESVIITYYWVFQSIAWSLILLAFFKLLLMRNVSLMNPQMRVSLKEGAMDLIITGVALIFTFPIINFLLSINMSLVGVFAAVGVDLNDLASFHNYNGTLSGVLMQFYYFFINLWLNFVYIVRGITIAILIVMSPLFVASIAFGGKWKGLFSTFIKELAGNIFMQAFHAFIISFLFAVTTGTRGIETAVTFFALIVLTEFFRSLVFGNAGGIAGQVGMGAVAAGAGLAIGAAKNRNNNNTGRKGEGAKTGNTHSREHDAGSGSGSTDTESSAYNSPIRTADSTQFNDSNGSHPSGGPGGGSLDPYAKGRKEQNDTSTLHSPNPLGKYKGGSNQEGLSNAGRAGLKTAGKVGLAGAGMAVGASYTAAFGGTSPMAAGVGGAIVGASARKAVGEVKQGGPKGQGGGFSGGSGGQSSGQQPMGVNNVQGSGSGSGSGSQPEGDWKNQLHAQPTVLGFTSFDDGTMDIHEDETMLKDAGILRAYETEHNGDKGVNYVYDLDKMSGEEAENLSNIQELYHNGTNEDRALLEKQGISGVSTNKDGNPVVSYNQAGMDKLGVQGVRTQGGRMTRQVTGNQTQAPRHSFPAQGRWQQEYTNNPSVVSVKSMKNQETQVKQDLHSLSEQGLVRANNTSNKAAEVTYNPDKLNNSHSQNIKKARNLYTNGTKEDRNALREQGIDNVTTNDNGHVTVKYNSVGMKNLGAKSFETKDNELDTVIDSNQAIAPVYSYNIHNATEYEKIKNPKPEDKD